MDNVPKYVAASTAAIAVSARARTGKPDDRELVMQAQKGVSTAFEELVRRHQQRISAVVGGILRRREDIEDVAQQVFLKAYISIGRFDMRSAFSTWLYKIAVNECWDYLRKKKVRPLTYEADLSEEQARHVEQFVSVGAEAGNAAERAELREIVERLLSDLSEEDRTMLVLKEAQGFAVEEIGQMLGLNVNTVKVRLFRARRRLATNYRRKVVHTTNDSSKRGGSENL
ncbi:MAG TPA: sigma-70 family RNA polymerase sigma factor [Candidatus Acidoferrales bacterium]|nr:sigma-70 family RNA polymerase sigma factor [Candidatus Acidoferrales bacterium]